MNKLAADIEGDGSRSSTPSHRLPYLLLIRSREEKLAADMNSKAQILSLRRYFHEILTLRSLPPTKFSKIPQILTLRAFLNRNPYLMLPFSLQILENKKTIS